MKDPGTTAGHRAVRAAAHVHSEWSDDGSWSLHRIARTFSRTGHDVVLMSEHSRGFSAAKWREYADACQEASTDRLLLVPGIEYGDEDDVVHIPVWGQIPFFGEATPIARLLPEATAAGGTAMWAHPWRRDAWRRFEPAWLDHLTAVEVWNRKYDGIAPSRSALALARREGIAAAVALDFHTRRQIFPLALKLDVAGEVTVPAVYAALSAGRFAPRAFGLPLGPLVRGPGGATLQALEAARRAARRTARRTLPTGH
ncbi:MAG TPA: hypothetical protein VMC03_02070 [Streptosporangiaceae bacterium]|nr:hypothetical protein [Streptosporangiaceae bacterium]